MTVEPSLRALVWRRAYSRCEYCRVPEALDPLPFQIDHIIARKHGGPTSEGNLALSCFACNHHKGPNVAGIDPRTGGVVRLFHPRKDRWEDHFEYRGVRLEGRSAVGTATVEVLGVNLPHRTAFRESLRTEGVFPPA